MMRNCASENPYSRSWLWIPGLRLTAHPGMTAGVERVAITSLADPDSIFKQRHHILSRHPEVRSAAIAPLACAPRRTTARRWPIHPSRLAQRCKCTARLAPQDDGRVSAFPRREPRPGDVRCLAPLEKKRAQGMPGARCTRGLVCQKCKNGAHEHTGQRKHSDIPCAMALRLISSSPR